MVSITSNVSYKIKILNKLYVLFSNLQGTNDHPRIEFLSTEAISWSTYIDKSIFIKTKKTAQP